MMPQHGTEMQKSLRHDGIEPATQICIRVRILNCWMGSQCNISHKKLKIGLKKSLRGTIKVPESINE